MPWSEKQRVAIFLSVKRKKGEAAAKALMHRHGYGGANSPIHQAIRARGRVRKA